MQTFKEFLQTMEIWLDDERDPNDPFIQEEFHSRPGMVWARTAEEAIELLKSNNVTYISFDHDLGMGKSGYDVARWIEEQAAQGNLRKLNWTVHTANPIGSKNIIMAMKSAERFWG
jgi:hypothetical protein